MMPISRTLDFGFHGSDARGVQGRVLVLGDSMAAGATVVEGDRIVERVACSFVDHVALAAPGISVSVDARPWRRTPELVDVVPALLETHTPDVVIVATGANDADIEWKRFVVSHGRIIRNRTRLSDYAAALASLAEECSGRGASMIVTEIISPPLRLRAPLLSKAAGRDLWPLFEECGGQPACDKVVAEYRAAAEVQAKESGFGLARTGLALESVNQDLVYADDGMHLNDSGHRVLAAALAPCVLSLLGRS
jgi:lysophospholipase L1-like esterase